jgi:hypothetical protein
MGRLRGRLIEVVDALRRDIDAGNTRDCQTAIEDLSDSFIELEESDVPANYVVRLRQEQAGLRKAALRIYHIQREEFLPSAYAMIVSFVIMILRLLLFTTIEGPAETLVTVAFLTFFFVYLLRLLNVINKPSRWAANVTTTTSVCSCSMSSLYMRVSGTLNSPASRSLKSPSIWRNTRRRLARRLRKSVDRGKTRQR